MRKKTRWPWKVYFFFWVYSVFSNIIIALYPASPINQYYKILIIFRARYWIQYSLYQSAIVIEAFSLIPLFLFVFHKKCLSPWVWQTLFFLRIIFLISGHSYEWMMIKSYFHLDLRLAIASASTIVVLLFPSFFGHFLYAFQSKKIFSAD